MARILSLVLLVFMVPLLAHAAELHPNERNQILKLVNTLASSKEGNVKAARQALLAKGDKAVPFLIDALKISPAEALRMEAAALLGEIRNEAALTPLFVASQVDTSARVRMAAQLGLERLLADLNDPRLEDTRWRDYGKVTRATIIEIKKRLKNDRDPRVRARAARSLGIYGSERDLDILYDRARRDEVAEVRIACYEGIRRLTYPIVLARDFRDLSASPAKSPRNEIAVETTKKMLARLLDEEEPTVRVAIVEQLAQCVYPIFLLGERRLSRDESAYDDHRWIINELTDEFSSDLEREDTHADVRLAEIRALVRLLSAYYRVGDVNVQDAIRRRLTSEVRRSYLGTIPTLDGIIVRTRLDRHYRSSPPKNDKVAERVTKAASKLYAGGVDWRLRQLAAEAIGLFGDKADSTDIIKGLSTEQNHDVWEAAIRALGLLDRNASATYLLNLYTNLEVPDRLRAEAARSIGLINYPRETRRLAGLLAREPSLNVRLAVIEALSYNRDAFAARALFDQLAHDKPKVRAAALTALQDNPYEGSASAIQSLLLKDPDPGVRAVAAVTLSILVKEPAIPALTHALGDESVLVRLAAAVELGLLNATRAAEALTAVATGDPDPDVRIEAVTSLGQIADPRIIQPLVRQALKEEDPLNRRAIYEALLAIRRPSSVIVAIWPSLPELQKSDRVVYEEIQVLIFYLREQNRGRNVQLPG